MRANDDTAYTASQFDQNYPDGIEAHYWNAARNRILERLLGAAGDPVVMDVGAGRGIVVGHLRQRGVRAWGCEAGHPDPIRPEVRPYLLTGTDLADVDEELRSEVDVFMLLDVLEHLPDPAELLRRCWEACPRANRALITVPARSELWSNYDEAFGHYRRYDAPSLRELLSKGNAIAVDVGYFFHALYPPMRLLSGLGRDRSTTPAPPRSGAGRALHRVLGAAFALEAAVLPRWLPGGSLYAVAHRARD